jgi:chromate reductase, NAD(P)H dehydrogenase (quinone)
VTTLLLVSGSQRRHSYNTRLLRWLASQLTQSCRLDLLEPCDVDLPLFNEDLERDADSVERAARLHRRFLASDGFIVACPEYNGQLTPYLKNLIDWVSRLAYIDSRLDNPFLDRPVLLCSASTGGGGGRLVVPHLRALFGYVGCVVIGDSISVPRADEVWLDGSFRFDEGCAARIAGALERVRNLSEDVAIRRTLQFETA